MSSYIEQMPNLATAIKQIAGKKSLSIAEIKDNLRLDCEQYIVSSKIRGEERKTGKRPNVTASVTCERRCHEPLVAQRLSASPLKLLLLQSTI